MAQIINLEDFKQRLSAGIVEGANRIPPQQLDNLERFVEALNELLKKHSLQMMAGGRLKPISASGDVVQVVGWVEFVPKGTPHS